MRAGQRTTAPALRHQLLWNRGRIGILSEAYSHDSLARRVASTYAFVKEVLSLVAEKGAAIKSLTARADSQPLVWGRSPDSVQMIAVRSELITTPRVMDVIKEDLEKTGDSSLTQPGVPRGERRTGRFRTVRMPVYDRFTSTLDRTPPAAYVVAPGTPRSRHYSGSTAFASIVPIPPGGRAGNPSQSIRSSPLRGRFKGTTKSVSKADGSEDCRHFHRSHSSYPRHSHAASSSSICSSRRATTASLPGICSTANSRRVASSR